MLGADQLHQLGGVTQVAGMAHARGQVAAQGDDATAADGPIQLEQLAEFLAGAAHARQVRRGLQLVVLEQVAHGLGGVAQRRAAGAEGAGHVLGRMRLEPAHRAVQLGALFVGLGRVELQADRDHFGRRGGKVAS